MTKEEMQQDESLTDESTNADETTLTDAETSESVTTENTESEIENAAGESDSSTEDEKPEENEEEDDGIKRIKKLNSENRNLRARLRDAEESLKNLGTDSESLKTLLSERDSYKTQYDDLLSSLRQERLTNAMTDVSRKAGAIEPSAVIALAAASDVAVEYDKEHKPTNVDAVVKSLKVKFPKLFGATAANGNAGARNERDANLDALTPKQRMAAGYEHNRS